MRCYTFGIPIALALMATSAQATDGVLEINQACAVDTGCFGGDGAGYPVTINGGAGRSYKLTSDLDLSALPPSDGIRIETDGVSLDLNGFELRGPVSCADSNGGGTNLNCTDIATGVGIRGGFRTQIHNGRVMGFGSGGIDISGGQISRVIAEQNDGTGIAVGESGFSLSHGSVVSDCVAAANDGVGLSVIFAEIRDSVAQGNNSIGISARNGSVINSISEFNGGSGISTNLSTSEALVSGNSVHRNGGTGIDGSDGVLIRNNQVNGNGGGGITVLKGGLVQNNTVFGNVGNGISADSSNLIVNNVARENTGFGLFFLGSQSNYNGNVMSINTTGQIGFGVNNSAINTGQNTCNNALCP